MASPAGQRDAAFPSLPAAAPVALTEAAWLVAAVVVPLAFNPLGASNFELPKAMLLQLIAALAFAGWVASQINTARPRRPTRAPIVLAVIVLAASWIASTVVSLDSAGSFWGTGARGGGALTGLASLALVLAIAGSFRPEPHRRRLWFAVLLAGSVMAIYALAQRIGLDPFAYGLGFAARSTSTVGNPGALGGALLLPLFVAGERCLALRGRPLDAAWLRRGGCTALLVAAMATTGSRAPWLGLVVGSLTWLLVASVRTAIQARSGPGSSAADPGPPSRLGRLWLALLLLGAALVLVFGIWFARAPLGAAAFGIGEPDGRPQASARSRLLIWEVAAQSLWGPDRREPEEAKEAPGWSSSAWRLVLGHGPETFDDVFVRYRTPFMDEQLAAGVDRAHNQVFDLLVTQGLLGLVATLGLLFAVAHAAFVRLGLIATPRDADTLGTLVIAGAAIGVCAPIPLALGYGLRGSHAMLLAGVGLPLGLLAGAAAWLGLRAAGRIGDEPGTGRAPAPIGDAPVRTILMLLGCVVAHLVTWQLAVPSIADATSGWIAVALLAACARRPTPDAGLDPHLPDRAAMGVSPQVVLASMAAATLGFAFLGAPDGLDNPVLRLLGAGSAPDPTSDAPASAAAAAAALWIGLVATVLFGTLTVAALLARAPGWRRSSTASVGLPDPEAWRRAARWPLLAGLLLAALGWGMVGPVARTVSADIYHRRAGALAAAGRFEAAGALHQAATRRWPHDARYWTGWGRDLAEWAPTVGEPERRRALLVEALPPLETAVRLEPWQPRLRSDVAAVLTAIGAGAKRAEQEAWLERALEEADTAAALAPRSRTLRDEATRLRILLAELNR